MPRWRQLSVVLSTVYVIFVHSTIYNSKHNPPKKLRNMSSKIALFLLLWCFKMQMKMSFMVFEKFGNFCKEV